jgi:hypothetical protein
MTSCTNYFSRLIADVVKVYEWLIVVFL